VASAGWSVIGDPLPYNAPGGSALAAGQVVEDPLVGSINAVWFMNGEGSSYNFRRYSVEDDAWAWMHDAPAVPKGGGALAFVPNFGTQGDDGWVFAFRGDDTRGFWCYHPDEDEWYDLTGTQQAPEEVTDGGALCYGGKVTIGAYDYAVIYAMTGQEHFQQQGSYWRGHVWRYAFRVDYVVTSPHNGTWTQLASFLYPVKKGGALAWSQYDGTLIATIGSPDDNVWELDPDAPTPVWTSWVTLDPKPYGGAALAARENDQYIWVLHGNENDSAFAIFNVDDHSLDELDVPPQHPEYGAGIAQVGDVCYAEFGGDNRNVCFAKWEEDDEGGQSRFAEGRSGVQVGVRASSGSHRFDVSGATGVVRLVVVDVVGREVTSVLSTPQNGTATLTWNHRGLQGLFLYRLTTGSFATGGKAIALR